MTHQPSRYAFRGLRGSQRHGSVTCDGERLWLGSRSVVGFLTAEELAEEQAAWDKIGKALRELGAYR